MALPNTQTGIVQSREPYSPANGLTVAVSHAVAMPTISSPNHVLVRVLAVALNPSDFKMVKYFPQPDTNIPIGCDFCGVVEGGAEAALERFPRGTRVTGAEFPYGTTISGAFAEWLVEAAAIGGICWGTCVVALFGDPEGLSLPGTFTAPASKACPVLVYGAATATGTMACQLLKLAGHSPIAVTSIESASLARSYGAVGAAAYTSPDCADMARALAPDNRPIRHALDCITSPESVAVCFSAIARAGGRYACLEGLKDEWRTRRAVRTREVMGFEGFGHKVTLGENTTYSRESNRDLYSQGNFWASEMQLSLDQGLIKPHPVCEVPGKWDGIIQGMARLQNGQVKGQKLTIRLGSL